MRGRPEKRRSSLVTRPHGPGDKKNCARVSGEIAEVLDAQHRIVE